MKNIVIFGCGGHSKVVLDIARFDPEISVCGFYDEFAKVDPKQSLPLCTDERELREFIDKFEIRYCFIAVGDNKTRKRLAEFASSLGLEHFSMIHPNAIVSTSAKIGLGSIVMANVVINADTIIGTGCILNSGSIIEHDSVISDYVHIAPGAVVCGAVVIGEGAFVAARAVAIPKVEIGDWSVVGAGAVVLENIPPNEIAYGVPARVK